MGKKSIKKAQVKSTCADKKIGRIMTEKYTEEQLLEWAHDIWVGSLPKRLASKHKCRRTPITCIFYRMRR